MIYKNIQKHTYLLGKLLQMINNIVLVCCVPKIIRKHLR